MSQIATESLVTRLQDLMGSGEFQLPPAPDLAVRLQTALEDDTTDLRQITSLIGTEPAVVATLLRTANSPALGFTSTTDVSRAISRLGMKQVQALVTAVLVQGQFEANRDSNRKTLQLLWTHAIASAAVAKNLAKRDGYPSDDAFLAGLLHGIGRLIVLRALDRLVQNDKELSPTVEEVDALVETLQYELGFSMLWSWNFSEDICEAARALNPEVDGLKKPIVRIVRAADAVARKLGMHPRPSPTLDLMAEDAMVSFHITEDEMTTLLAEWETEIEEVKSAFGGV